MNNFAVMVCLDGKDDWIYITEDSESNCWDLRPVLFNNYADAVQFSHNWVLQGKPQNVRIVTYES